MKKTRKCDQCSKKVAADVAAANVSVLHGGAVLCLMLRGASAFYCSVKCAVASGDGDPYARH